MGWLFAVGLGLQEQQRRAVWRALLPLAAGHALAIGSAVAVGLAIGAVVPVAVLKWVVAVVLLAFGLYRVFRGRHLRWVGMRVGPRDLTLWSLLMASAHGAGLMVLPFVLGPMRPERAIGHHHHEVPGAVAAGGIFASAPHAGYLAMTALAGWSS
jgi:hypothetical protein